MFRLFSMEFKHDGKLSPHFSRQEFECRCCGRLVVNHNLLDGLEALRNLASVAVFVNAGYRGPQRNQEVGGVPNSEPARGRAADIRLPDCHGSGCTNSHWRFHHFAPGGIAAYDGDFLHVDVRDHRARWAACMVNMSESTNGHARLSSW